MRALYRVRFASLFSRMRPKVRNDDHRASVTPEEKPITVDRPNRTYVFYLVSKMKFDEACKTRDETRARTWNRTMCDIGRDKRDGKR